MILAIGFPSDHIRSQQQARRDEIQLSAHAAYEQLQRSNPDELSRLLACRVAIGEMPYLVIHLPPGWKVLLIPNQSQADLWVCRP